MALDRVHHLTYIWAKGYLRKHLTNDERDLSPGTTEGFQTLYEYLRLAVASSEGLKRILSIFGLVHLRIRSRLGTEKAHQIFHFFKSFNQFENGIRSTTLLNKEDCV